MFFDPSRGMKPKPFRHTVYNALVVPRPIGWISTLGEDGVINLAPFSFFNAPSGDPPCVMYCPNSFKPGTREQKDSLARLGYLQYVRLDLASVFSMRPPGGDERFDASRAGG